MPTVFPAAAHRAYPPPAAPWIMRQTWYDLLFAHWPIDADRLAELLPPPLEPDTFHAQAWIGVVPFAMRGVRFRFLPPLPSAGAFLELNVRTYVTCGGRPGVYFFSLDAESRLAIAGARSLFRLPYRHARMQLERSAGVCDFTSRRIERGWPPAEFAARYRASGPAFHSAPGSLEEFLTERYCLYVVDRGRVLRAEVHHARWPLQEAEVEIERNTMTDSLGLALEGPPLAHLAREVETWVWMLRRVGAPDSSRPNSR